MSASAAQGEAGRGVATFRVGMTCEGCEGAVRRILGRFDGAEVGVDLPGKTVTVQHAGGEAQRSAMLAALQKWGAAAGKEVALLP